ncbi:HlyD family secretion protein, partial [Alphaproteobacteria bacterium]|nr:HlyD family secretion protein [Alphaproteobacteria bacterium]
KIKSVEVSAGDRVKKGDILFVLDPEQDAGGLKEKILEAKNLQTQKRRHIAQLNQSTDFKKVAGDDDGIYQQELSQLKLELGVFWNQIETYESEKNLIKKEISSAEITIQNLQDLSKLLDVKFDVIKQLYEKKYEGELAYLEAQQKATEALGNIAVAQQNVQRLIEKSLSLDKQIQQLMLNFDRDVSAQISDISQRLEFTLINIDTLSQRVQEYEVKSPVDGTVSKVFFNNVGEVVAKASTLGELIPKGRPLIFAGKLKPGDILDVNKGQETLVTLSNMDTRTEPPILGRVSNVEKNSRVEEGYGRYFQVEIEFVEPDQTKTIMPGVDGSASILMGKRSVLEYVLEPIFASFKGALSE